MDDICTRFDELRAQIAQAQRRLHSADQTAMLAAEDEAFSDGTGYPGAHEIQQAMEDHLNELQAELNEMTKGWS